MATDDQQDSALLPAAPPGFSDHTFTPPSGVELAVRVWPAETPVNEPAPFIIWSVKSRAFHPHLIIGTYSL